MRFLTPLTLAVLAVLLFFTYTTSAYQELQEIEAREQEFDDALDRSQELLTLRDELLLEYNSFAEEDLDRLNKLLPDNVDNVRLVLELDSIAAQYDMSLQTVSIQEPNSNSSESDEQRPNLLNSLVTEFTVAGPYADFLSFMNDIERSIRVVDVEGVGFSPTQELDFNEYQVRLRTYWLSK